MNKYTRWLVVVLVCSMLLEGAALAASSTPRAEAAATTTKELRFRIGGEQATVNGVVFKAEKPYQVNGTTMVPVGMLRQAFGVNVNWTVDKKEFTLAIGNRKAKMEVGKTRALINRKDVVMAQAPVFKNGNLMVPLRSAAEMLNATVSTSSNGQVLVTWDANEKNADMTRVGSKSDNWSIYLPEGWYYVDNPETGFVSFFQENGASESMLLEITDGSDSPNPTAYDLMDLLIDMYVEEAEIVDGSINTKSNFPYAQIRVAYYDDNGEKLSLEASRIYQLSNQDRYQLTIMGDVITYNHKSILNSFRPAYMMTGVPVSQNDRNESSMREVTVKDAGITFTVPAHWYVDAEYGYGESQFGMQQLEVHVQDAKGLTTDQLRQKRMEYMHKTYIPGTFKVIEEQEYTLASGQKGWLTSYVSDHGRGKFTEYVFDVVDQGFYYTITFADSFVETGNSLDALIFVKMVKIDPSKVKGDVQAPVFIEDWNAVKKYELSKIQATMEIPSSWIAATDPHGESYFFYLPISDYMSVDMIEDVSIAEAKRYEDQFFEEAGYLYSNVLDETETIKGKAVRFLEYKYKEHEYDFETVMSAAFIQDGHNVYVIYLYASSWRYSDDIKKQFRKAVESLVVVK